MLINLFSYPKLAFIVRTKGGNNIKIHAIVNHDCIPLRILLTKGNMSDMNKKILEPLINGFESFIILGRSNRKTETKQ